jgi:DNA-binding CsgD family transcriptional regulator
MRQTGSIKPLIAVLDREGRAAWISRGDSGVPRNELLGTTIWDWTVPEDCDLSRRHFADCLFSGRPQEFFVTVNANGTLVGQRVRLDPIGGPLRPVVVTSKAIPPGVPFLTGRQAEVARLVGECFNRKQIARMLGISVVTVDAHCHAAAKILGLRSAADLAVFSAIHLHD